MPLDDLLVALEQQAGEEARELLHKAGTEAAELELRSNERLAHRRAEARAGLEMEHRARLERGLAEARHEGRRVVLEARDRFLARVQEVVREQFPGVLATAAYRNSLPGQLAEVLGYLGQVPATLRCHPSLIDQLRGLTAGKEWLTLVGDPSVSAGFTAASGDGVVTIGCTLDDRLKRLWPALAVDVLRRFESDR